MLGRQEVDTGYCSMEGQMGKECSDSDHSRGIPERWLQGEEKTGREKRHGDVQKAAMFQMCVEDTLCVARGLKSTVCGREFCAWLCKELRHYPEGSGESQEFNQRIVWWVPIVRKINLQSPYKRKVRSRKFHRETGNSSSKRKMSQWTKAVVLGRWSNGKEEWCWAVGSEGKSGLLLGIWLPQLPADAQPPSQLLQQDLPLKTARRWNCTSSSNCIPRKYKSQVQAASFVIDKSLINPLAWK